MVISLLAKWIAKTGRIELQARKGKGQNAFLRLGWDYWIGNRRKRTNIDPRNVSSGIR